MYSSCLLTAGPSADLDSCLRGLEIAAESAPQALKAQRTPSACLARCSHGSRLRRRALGYSRKPPEITSLVNSLPCAPCGSLLARRSRPPSLFLRRTEQMQKCFHCALVFCPPRNLHPHRTDTLPRPLPCILYLLTVLSFIAAPQGLSDVCLLKPQSLKQCLVSCGQSINICKMNEIAIIMPSEEITVSIALLLRRHRMPR